MRINPVSMDIMKALVLVKDKVLEYKEVEFPEKIGLDSVLVRVAYSGICGSDIKRAFGGGAYHYPLIMGHEFSGTVEDSFKGSCFSPGDRVVVYPLLPCGKCTPCRTAEYSHCVDYDYFGSRRNGGFAEYVYVPESNLLSVPRHIDLRHAAMTEPCAVALHGVDKLHIRPGSTGAVFGGGPVGNMVAQWLRIRGCSPVVVVDIDEEKLSAAGSMGFKTVNPAQVDPVSFIREETGGADCVVEACGLPKTFLQSIQAAGRFAEVVFLGNLQGKFIINEKDFSGILRRELRIYGTWNSRIAPRRRNDWNTALKHLDRNIAVAPLITHTPDLKEGAGTFRQIADGSFGPYSKVIFTVTPDTSGSDAIEPDASAVRRS